MHKTISKNRFKTLGKLLAKNGIDIDYMVDWSSSMMHDTDQPRLGSFSSNGIPGWYFTKSNKNDFNNSEKKIIKDVFKSKGFKVVSISDYEVEWDNDRSYKPNINFILKNDN
tara:strand:+ start:44 stop:379 length:336 start_codon:yes stop_codon:yes gene_type:complete